MKTYFYPLFLIVYLLFISSCKTNDPSDIISKTDIIQTDSYQTSYEHLILATLWFQKSAEAKACYYQTYMFAEIVFDKKFTEWNPSDNKKPAIILDIDETVIDNSPFEAHCISSTSGYSKEEWKVWSEKANADAMPGAIDFLNYVKSKGVEAFYVSNRKPDELESTMKNMKKLGFPFVEEKYFYLRTDEGSKKQRRETLTKDYDILLYLGDNLADFSEIYEERDKNLAIDIFEQNKTDFGSKFIIFPNPMYGDWEKAIYKNNNNFSELQKDSLRKAALSGY